MKTVICGPPHSGKSVFIANLAAIMPGEVSIIRACPDGEGTWSNNQDQDNVRDVRHKGRFSQEFIDTSCRFIDNQSDRTVVLVDVGGRITPENEQIFRHCDSYIVLSSDEQAKQDWFRFGSDMGLRCLAVLDSVLEGTPEVYTRDGEIPVVGRISGLERGTYQQPEVLKRTAAAIITHTNEHLRTLNRMTAIPNGVLLTDNMLGNALGIVKETVLDEALVSSKTTWTPESLGGLQPLLEEIKDQEVNLYGVKANFAMAAVCETLRNNGCQVRLYDKNTASYLPIVRLEKGSRDSPYLDFDVRKDGHTAYIEVTSKVNYFEKSDFDRICLPDIRGCREIYLSGRLPHWATAEILATYDADKVHLIQPGNCYICVQDKNGTEIGKTTSIADVQHQREEIRNMTAIKLSELAERIGNQPQEITLPNGTKRQSIVWDAPTAQKALAEAYPLSLKGDPVVIDGPAPAWFVSSLTHIVHPCEVSLNDPKVGAIPLPHLERGQENPAGEIAFHVEEGKDAVQITWSISNGTMPPVYDYKNLPNITVPEITSGKPLYVSGRGPNYITAAIGEAYAHTQKSVSYFQPQNHGYFCGITHDSGIKIGEMTPETVVKEKLEEKENTKDERIPDSKGKDTRPSLDELMRKASETMDRPSGNTRDVARHGQDIPMGRD